MAGQSDDDDQVPLEDLPVVAWLMFMTALGILLGVMFLYAAATVVATIIIASSSQMSWMDITETTPSLLVPYFIIIAAGAVYVTYLTIFWHFHRRLSRLALYILIAIGGIAIPVAVSVSHYFNYRRSPPDYVIPAEKLPHLRQLGAASLGRTRVAHRRLQEFRDLIGRLVARQPSLPARLRFVDGPPSTTTCSRLDLGPQTGALCVGRRFIFIASPSTGRDSPRPPVVVEQPEVWLNPGRRVTADSLDLVVLFETPLFHCDVLRAFGAPLNGRDNGADTERLFRCLSVAQRAMEASMRIHRQALDRAPAYPDISYWVILLDSVAGIVDADYSVLEPVSPLAGFVSVTGSVLTLAYFAVFASLVLEAVSSKKSGRGVKDQ